MGVGYRNVPPDQYNNDFGGEPGSLRPDDYSDIGQANLNLSASEMIQNRIFSGIIGRLFRSI